MKGRITDIKIRISYNNANILNIFYFNFKVYFRYLTDYPLQKCRIVCKMAEKIACVLFL